ncbi:MAG: hypothetical protein KF842_06720 [Caulobacter sp.]|nr:hypothetical protein [Caulobacter sp.]
MPYRDPAWWAALRDQAGALAGGGLAAMLHLALTLAAPRPWPKGMLTAAAIEAFLALVAGFIAGVFIGPLVGHFLGVSGAEALGGIKTIIGVVAWKALPVVRDGAGNLLAGWMKRKSESL